MDKTYDPKAIEADWYRRWEDAGAFAPAAEGNPFCIMIPPPNVTGTLHMGHAFQDTLMDILTRWRRMQNRAALWQVGTDHAGIATQIVVERKLEQRGTSRSALGREQFEEEVWKWKHESGGHISRQLRRLGASADWSRERFTMDDGLSDAVREVFVRLHEEGLLYRGTRLVNWDPVLRTALSDLEVVSVEEKGKMCYMRYPSAEDPTQYLVIATTRPETMLADGAVAVHPDDERYTDWVGKMVALPLCDLLIPVIADEYVKQDFGSGCVKISSAHDFNDYQVGQRHNVPMHNIFTDTAHLNDVAPEAYRGLSREEARVRVLEDLDAQGLLDHIDDNHMMMVPRGDRSGSIVEPYLTDQWYVRMEPLAREAIAAVRDKRVQFVPENWDRTYYEWMENIEDWCISRQLWWGHRIPAWYDEAGAVYVGRSEAEVREKHGLGDDCTLRQDEDVLDTWFSSALWPFSTLGWPDETTDLERFYPTQVLVTGFDIIFFWVARMVMMGLHFKGEVPFQTVYVHGLVRDAHGQKMSKSKGNTIDPIDVIDGIALEPLVEKRIAALMDERQAQAVEKTTREEFPDGFPESGTDALRFCFATQATFGHDVRFELPRVLGYRNFCNKLWNAARYALNHADGLEARDAHAHAPSLVDYWIQAKLAQTARAVNEHLEAYRFDLAAQTLYDSVWHDFCDWYLELSKVTLHADSAPPAEVHTTRWTLFSSLEQLLRLLHPFMPFVTEELHRQLPAEVRGAESEFLMHRAWPDGAAVDCPEGSLETAQWMQDFIAGVRKIRAELNIPPSKPVPILLADWDAQDRERFAQAEPWITGMARPAEVRWLEGEEPPESAVALVGAMRILIPLAGLVDQQAERDRLDRELKKLQSALEICQKKLGNDEFVANAPDAVVEKERAKLAELTAAHEQLSAQQQRLQ